MNALVEQWDEADEERRIGARPRAVPEYFAVGRRLLQPTPDGAVRDRAAFTGLRVDRFSQVSVRTTHYSGPVRLISRTLQVLLHAGEVVVYDGRTDVARHEQLTAQGQTRPDLDHYLGAWSQARCVSRGHRAGAGPLGGEVHSGPRHLVGGGLQRPR